MKILIVDDDALIREGLEILIDLEEDMEVAGVASNGREAYDFCRDNSPDIVLMDVRMPVVDGVIGTKLIKDDFKNIKVIILTTFKDDEYIKQAIKNGAQGYILKNQSSKSIIESIRAVAAGNVVLEKDVLLSLSEMLKDNRKKPETANNLSQRDVEILALIGRGLSNKEIAKELYLGEGTVRNYITALLNKLDLRDRTQLAIFYLENIK